MCWVISQIYLIVFEMSVGKAPDLSKAITHVLVTMLVWTFLFKIIEGCSVLATFLSVILNVLIRLSQAVAYVNNNNAEIDPGDSR